MNTRARHWSFTINNPTSNDWTLVDKLVPQCSYLRAQPEKGEDGTAHIQGCCGMHNPLYFSTMKKALPRAHIEMTKHPHFAWDYCHKEESRQPGKCITHGERPMPKTAGLKQNQWKAYQTYAADHTWLECFDNWPELVHKQGAMRSIFERKFNPNEVIEKQVTCFWGPPGSGKTMSVLRLIDKEPYFRSNNGKWFDGYAYEDVLFLDDFGSPSNKLPRNLLLQLLDRGTVRMEVKGGSTLVRASRIYITSNYSPNEWYEQEEKKLADPGAAVMRRMTTYHTDGMGQVKLGTSFLCMKKKS